MHKWIHRQIAILNHKLSVLMIEDGINDCTTKPNFLKFPRYRLTVLIQEWLC